MAGFSRFGAACKRLEEKYLHGNCVTERSAFELQDSVEFLITVPDTTIGAVMEVVSDATNEVKRIPMKRERDRFVAAIRMEELCGKEGHGLFYYKYRIATEMGCFDLQRRESDFAQKWGTADVGRGGFQLLVYQKREKLPTWLYGGIFYQIFPDRFFGAGKNPEKENAVVCRDAKKFPDLMRVKANNDKNNLFFGGDLQGVREKLDYLKSLGVTCLYLNPIFESTSNHKYNTADYSRIDEMLGGEEAFAALLKAAKERDIAIVLDGVFNHTGSESVYFNQTGNYPCIGACQSKKSQYYKWFNFHRYPDSYESWWGIETLPRVKSDEASYRSFLFGKNGIVRKYTRMGIDGWRLDVADELSDRFLAELSKTVLEENPHAVVIGEVWEDATTKVSYGVRKTYFHGNELDSVMNYPMQKAIIAYLTNGDYALFMRTLESIYGNYPPEMANALMNLLGTHDTERILTALGDTGVAKLPYEKRAGYRMPPKQRERALKRLRLAVAIQMAIPGVPCIYYGDEAGMEGYKDPFSRLPYPWGEEDEALLSFYRTVAAARRAERTFADGTVSFVYADADVLCFERHRRGYMVVVLVNRGKDVYEIHADCCGTDLITGVESKEFILGAESFSWIKLPDGVDYNVFVTIQKNKTKAKRP